MIKLNWSVSAVLCAVLLSACGQDHSTRDLSAYIDKVKQNAVLPQHNEDLTRIPPPEKTVSTIATRRDPFQETKAFVTQKNNATPINAFPLSMLKFSGVIIQEGKQWALVITPDGKINQVTLGDKIGDRYSQITKITADHLELREELLDSHNHPIQQHNVTMPIKDGSTS